jgi:hypothetical protein
MKSRVILSVWVIGLFFLGSCIFQNDPLKPNNPPVIEFSHPPQQHLSMTVPDSCLFVIQASDADGDIIDYRFLVGDSVLGLRDTVLFFAVDSGYFHLQGLAMDGSECATRSWHINIDAKPNEPPLIIKFLPSQQYVSCTVGETLEFVFSAIDDDPEDLVYSYELSRVEGGGVRRFYGSPTLVHRFLERGEFDLRGIVWDGEYGDTTRWFVDVTGDPDTIAPGAVTDLDGRTGDDLGHIMITWTAPGDDGSDGTASAYEVRTSTELILTEEDWDEASPKKNTPEPGPAGTIETMVVRALNPGTYVYLTMRAIDDFFNYSPLGNCIRLLVRGIDAMGYAYAMHTGEPLGGIYVTSYESFDTTDASGAYLLKNLPYYVNYMRASDENAAGEVGAYYDSRPTVYDPGEVIEHDFYLMPNLGIQSAGNPGVYKNRFILFFKEVTRTNGRLGRSTVYHGWNHWPLTVHNPDKVFGDIDLQSAARGAMEEWEAMTGYDLFIEVIQKADADILIVYNDVRDGKDYYDTVEWNPDGTPKVGEITIFPANTYASVITAHYIYAHELGHALGFLTHSSDSGHIMFWLLSQVRHVTIDEANVIKIVHNTPFIFDYGSAIEE